MPTSWLVSGAFALLACVIFGTLLTRRFRLERAGLVKQHRETAAELERQSAILQAVLHTMDEGVIVTDAEGAFVVFNPAAERIIGRERADVPPSAWPETYGALNPEDGHRIERDEFILLKAMRGETPEPAFAVFRQGPGARGVHVRAVAKPVRDGSGTLLGAAEVLHDITELKEAEAERRALIASLERRNTELERFTYTVSHELRAPLVTISGFLGFLRKDALEGNEERLIEDADRISGAVATMGELLEDLLRLSRSGMVVDAGGSVDLRALIEEVLDSLSGPLSAAGIRVVLDDELPEIRGDERRLFEVLHNLTENATKFMGTQEDPTIRIGTRKVHAGIECFVEDNGVGIGPEHRERVFRIFERLDASVPGTGVGLALARSVIEAHKGSIWIETVEGGPGTRFVFRLPDETSVNETIEAGR